MPDPLPSAAEAVDGFAAPLARVIPPNGPPLDFSFQDLSDLAGPPSHTPHFSAPTSHITTPHTPPPASLPITDLPSHEINDSVHSTSVPLGEPSGLRLSYNALKSVDSLPTLLNSSLPPLALFPASPLHSLPLTSLHWLDLSNNALPSVPHHLHSLPHLSTLYLHSNRITSLASLSSLLPLPHLCKLTLHGNPVTQPPRGKARVGEVRLRVLGILTRKEGARIKQLDFVGVSENEVLAGLRLLGGRDRRAKRAVNKVEVEADEE